MPFDDAGQRPELKNPNVEELAIIDRMRQLLGRPEDWCKRALVQIDAAERVSHCLLGALVLADGGELPDAHYTGHGFTWAASQVRIRLNASHSSHNMVNFNNALSTSHADILGLLRRVRAEFE